jgi:hypothetical protein
MVAQGRGDLATAEGWYRKSLEINEALGNRPGLALTYGLLGCLAEDRMDPALALDWVVRCIALFSQFPHPATAHGPDHLVRLTAQLGLPALEASWRRCTGAAVPEHIRTAVAAAIVRRNFGLEAIFQLLLNLLRAVTSALMRAANRCARGLEPNKETAGKQERKCRKFGLDAGQQSNPDASGGSDVV